MTLDGKSIARCLKPENFVNVVNYTLHHFSDACENGSGQNFLKKTLWPLFMDGVQLHQGYRATMRR